jgi:hypothetical protein
VSLYLQSQSHNKGVRETTQIDIYE